MPLPLDQQTLVRNIHACILICKGHDEGRPDVRCIHNRQRITDNATANACPHPNGSRFELVPLNFAPKATSGPLGVGGPPGVDAWQIAGPLLWRELHRWTLTAHLERDRDWLKNFLTKVFCSDCKDHAIRWIASNPPDFSSHEKLFAWGVDFHNAVNARIDKPTMTVEAALARWSKADAPAMVITTPGCKSC